MPYWFGPLRPISLHAILESLMSRNCQETDTRDTGTGTRCMPVGLLTSLGFMSRDTHATLHI